MSLYDPVCAIECGMCGAIAEFSHDSVVSKEDAKDHFESEGWAFDEFNESFCPGCFGQMAKDGGAA